jgi:hypothetical protein
MVLLREGRACQFFGSVSFDEDIIVDKSMMFYSIKAFECRANNAGHRIADAGLDKCVYEVSVPGS